jgi:hypothetical protein
MKVYLIMANDAATQFWYYSIITVLHQEMQ